MRERLASLKFVKFFKILRRKMYRSTEDYYNYILVFKMYIIRPDYKAEATLDFILMASVPLKCITKHVIRSHPPWVLTFPTVRINRLFAK